MINRRGKPRCPYLVNYANFQFTRLMDQNDQFQEKVNIGEAKQLAKNANLDLVCFNEPDSNNLAFCKIIDYGKWKYQEEKKKRKQNKEGKKTTKEVRLSPVISDHDLEHKMKQANEFLKDGNDLMLSMRLKGRQRAHFNEAEQRMNEIISMCNDSKEVYRRKSKNMISVRLCYDVVKE